MISGAETGRSLRRDRLVLVLLAAALFLPAIGARDLWNPNEPTYGLATREMFEHGDWLVPTVRGEPFAEKPILYFWLALAASHLLGGVSETALRLPSALAGIAGVAMVHALAAAYAGRRRAMLAAGLFLTTSIVFQTARQVQMDLLLTATTLGAVLAASRVLDHGFPPWTGGALAGLAAGLGFLAKGPVGWICPGLAIVLYVAVGRRWRALSRRAVLAAVAVSFAIVAAWIAALAAAGGTGLLEEMLLRQNVTRFLQPWDHVAPWWYFGVNFWIDMAPWGFFVPLAAALPGRDAGERSLDRLAWVWLIGVIAFFSLSASKRSVYILPVAPAVAVLASGVLDRFFGGSLERFRERAVRGLVAAEGAVFAAGGIVIAVVAISRYPLLETPLRAVSLLLFAGGSAALAGSVVHRKLPAAAPAALGALLPCLYLLVGVWLMPAVDVYKSTRPFCEGIDAVAAPGQPVGSYRPWRWRAGFQYYCGRPIVPIETPAALASYWNGPGPVFLIVGEGRADEVRSVVGNVEPVFRRAVGGRTMILLEKRDSREGPAGE